MVKSGACTSCCQSKIKCTFAPGATACCKCIGHGHADQCTPQESCTHPSCGTSAPPASVTDQAQHELDPPPVVPQDQVGLISLTMVLADNSQPSQLQPTKKHCYLSSQVQANNSTGSQRQSVEQVPYEPMILQTIPEVEDRLEVDPSGCFISNNLRQASEFLSAVSAWSPVGHDNSETETSNENFDKALDAVEDTTDDNEDILMGSDVDN